MRPNRTLLTLAEVAWLTQLSINEARHRFVKGGGLAAEPGIGRGLRFDAEKVRWEIEDDPVALAAFDKLVSGQITAPRATAPSDPPAPLSTGRRRAPRGSAA